MEITRVLMDGTTVSTPAELTATAGLLVAPVVTRSAGDDETGAEPDLVVAEDQWVVVHGESGRPVVQLPMPRSVAHRFAVAISSVDWSQPRESIRGANPEQSEHLAAVRTALEEIADAIGMTDGEYAESEDQSPAEAAGLEDSADEEVA